jgi:glutamine synthetase
MPTTLEDARKLIAEHGVEFFLCSFVEMSGAPKAKLVPATHLDDMAGEGAGFAGYAAGEIGQGPHSPDLIAMPDFASTTVLPWRPNIAWVAGNCFVNGQSWDYCPRTVLQRYLDRVRREWGYTLMTGVEAEFHLVGQDERGGWQPYDRLDTLSKPCYDIRALHRNLDIMTTLIKYMQQIGWDPYANDHEDANCQFEINFTYSDALTTADRHTFFKWMVKTVAEQNGLTATFMPKPFAHLTGNGAHFHMSLWDAERNVNLFDDSQDEMGLSPMAYHFCGGLMKHAKALAAVTNPLVNSYKRLIRGAPNSGATWAPVYVTYGGSNRTQMIRIPGPGRIENRIIDGAANPYLAATALLAAGLDGLKNKIDPGVKNTRNLYEVPEARLKEDGIEFLPVTLKDALDHFEADEVLRDAVGQDYAAMYLRAKREEWDAYHRSVSQWELDNYLATY